MKTAISERRVVCSGVVVTQNIEPVKIWPFDDDPEFEVEIVPEIVESSSDTRIDLDWDVPDDEKRVRVLLKRHLGSRSFSNRNPLLIAETDEQDGDYYLNLFLLTTGNRESFTTAISFCIYLQGRAS